jgi:hypothetical protein
VIDRDAERMRAELSAADARRPDRYRDGHGRAHAGGSAAREVGVSVER